MKAEEQNEIVRLLSEQLAGALRALSMEQAYPSSGADEMDDKINRLQARVDHLRRIRNDYEQSIIWSVW
jgi:hypothetical protein